MTDRRGMPVVRTVTRDTLLPSYAIKSLVGGTALVQRMSPERLDGLADRLAVPPAG